MKGLSNALITVSMILIGVCYVVIIAEVGLAAVASVETKREVLPYFVGVNFCCMVGAMGCSVVAVIAAFGRASKMPSTELRKVEE